MSHSAVPSGYKISNMSADSLGARRLGADLLANRSLVCLADDDVLAQVTLALGGFARQKVAGERLAATDLAGPGDLESFGRAAVCLHLGHR